MFEIKLDTKDFIHVLRNIANIFLELPIEVSDDGFRVKNISKSKEVAITLDFDKKDMESFKYDNKNPAKFMLPYGEFLDATKKIYLPLEIGEIGQSKISLKSGQMSFTIDKLAPSDDERDMYKLHDTIIATHTKKDTTLLLVNSSDFMFAVDQLSFTSGGIKMTIENGQLIFESLKGSLTGKYTVDVNVEDSFEWESSFNTAYMKMLKNLAIYSNELKFYVKNQTDEMDDIPPVLVEVIIAPNSEALVIIAAQKDEASISVDQDIEDEDSNDLDFEDDNFYDEEE